MDMSQQPLDFWWWGEDEAPGLGSWLEQACSAFKTKCGDEVRLRLLRHDEVLPGFPAAMEAGEGPDLHFFWNGIYLVDHVWRGFVAPLDGLLEPDELAVLGGGPQSQVGGRTYRAGWYVIPVVWVVNRNVLDSSGVNAIPETYAEFVQTCTQVKTAGFRPVTVGDGEGDFSVWWLTHFLTQELDEPADAVRLVLGDLDWRDPRYSRPWQLLGEVRDLGLLDAAALPMTLWAGLERFNEGRSAFTLASGPMLAGCRRALGNEAVVSVAPVAGAGRLAGLPIVDTQGIGISVSSKRPEASSRFLTLLHDEERRRTLWNDVHLFPADSRWEGPGADADPDYQRMWEWYAHGSNAPYVPNLMPLELHYRLAVAIGQSVLTGALNSSEAGEAAFATAREWREADSDRTARYREWALEAGAGSEAPPRQ